jgi:RNA polymerase sigma factor (sigma-70 family)
MMFDRATRLFLRWRDRGDAEALAAVFDRTAPELLRLALHLCRNVADAEDLLQGTFLAAIQSAARFDAQKKVTPWLVGILTHQAQAEHRRKQRSPAPGAEPDSLPQTAAEPPAAAATRELSDSVRHAVEQLREPFRQPTLLRLVHGMEPAEIALLLQRSPGTVRAQIHRGIEQARRAVPQGLALGLIVGLATAGRGLAAVRSVVLAEGARVSATSAAAISASSSAVLLGVLMSKKSVLIATVVLCSLVAFRATLWFDNQEALPARIGENTVVSRTASVATSNAEVANAPDVPNPTERTAAPAIIDAGSWTLRAQVIDGRSKQPIAGAAVAVHGPRTMTLLELQREFADASSPGPTGIPIANSEALHLPQELPPEITVGGQEHAFLVPPSPNAPPRASTTTDADGRFELLMPASGGVLTVRAAGHGMSQVALDKEPERQFEIWLWPTCQLVGFVRTDHGEVPPVPLDLLLRANGAHWLTRTDAQGRFTAEVAAERVEVECRTPGWTTTRERIDPVKGRRTCLRSVSTAEQGTVYVTRFGTATLHVTDAVTNAPIETISLRVFDQNTSPRYCGHFASPGGFFALEGFGAHTVLDYPKNQREMLPNRATVTVWSEGYVPFTVHEVALYGSDLPVIEAKLERGSVESYTGRVVRSGKAVAGLRIGLRTYNQLNWQSNLEFLLAMQVTTEDGGFALAAPSGDYVCEVYQDGDCLAQFAISLPCAKDQIIDLAEAVFVDVLVVDAQGHARPDHNVAVNGPGYQSRQGKTGADGHLVLGPFASGKLTVSAPRVPTEASWSGSVSLSVDATAGPKPTITLRLPPSETIRATLSFEGGKPNGGFEGFTACGEWDISKGEYTRVEPNGVVPLDLIPGGRLAVRAPGGRQWSVEIPADARPGHLIVLRWTGLAYAGVLNSQAGRPLANTRVFAAAGGSTPFTSAVTDANGAFRLEGLDALPYRLSFDARVDSSYPGYQGNPYSRQWFMPATLPSEDPAPMHIELARFEEGRFVGRDEVAVVGRALDASGQPIANAIVGTSTLIPQDGGTLELHAVSDLQSTSADGSFRLLVSRGDRYRSSIARSMGGTMQTADFTLSLRDSECQHDIVFH